MAVLLIIPDYASHYLPLVGIGQIWKRRGEEVIVATGPFLRNRVRLDGFGYVELKLSAGGNPGLVRIQPSMGAEMEDNVEASRHGMIEILRYQAMGRERDLFWKPEYVLRRLEQILSVVRPRLILSVQLAYNATAALLALNEPFTSFVTGHPSEFPGTSEVYGYPYYRPRRFTPRADELASLKDLCKSVQDKFTKKFNSFLKQHNPGAPLQENALSAASQDLILLNYPPELGAYRSPWLPKESHFIGSSLRSESLDCQIKLWLEHCKPEMLTVYVSLGTFFSVRDDVIRRIILALRSEPVRVILVYGVSNPIGSCSIPDHWLLREYVPQVAVLGHCDLTICHGGNNTVTEALSVGVPLLVGPLSSDQFAGAADIEEFQLGAVFDPNLSSPAEIRRLMGTAIRMTRNAKAISARLLALNGALKAVSMCEQMSCKANTGTKERNQTTRVIVQSRIRVGLLAPCLIFGGAERWMLNLARFCDSSKFTWTICVVAHKLYEHGMLEALATQMPVYLDGRLVHRGNTTQCSLRDAKEMLLKESDLVLGWEFDDDMLRLADSKRVKVVNVAHRCDQGLAKFVRDEHYLVAVCDSCKLAFDGGKNRKVTIIENGIDVNRCNPITPRRVMRSSWNCTEQDTVIGFIGRIDSQKNCVAIARAVKALGNSGKGIIYGSLSERSNYIVDRMKEIAGKQVSFFKPVEEIGCILGALDVLMLPSYTEGLSLTLLEAWGASTPVVATRVGELPGLEERFGQLIIPIEPEASGAALVDAVYLAAYDPASAKIRKRAKKIVLENFNVEFMVRKWSDFIESVVQDSI